MPHGRIFPRLALALLLAAAPALAQQAGAERQAADVGRLRAHVAYLASEKLEGRKTGTPGAQLAADYVEAEFRRLGLRPGGANMHVWASPKSHSVELYQQAFPYVAAVELGAGNTLALTTGGGEGGTRSLRAGEDWMPLGFSANARVERARAAFVGYGITAADAGHDDYKDARARGRVAVAFAGTPDGDNPHGRFARAGDLRFKAAAARAAGALALVLVARAENFREEPLARLSYDNAGDAGLPVVVVSRQTAARLLGLGGEAQLSDLEKSLQPGAGAEHAGLKLNLTIVTPQLESATLTLAIDVARRNAPAANVVALLPGTDPKLREEFVVVGAHYDHLGRGGRGSLAPREGDIHHGADDNASGTAALLELARLLSRHKERVRRTVVFVAFGGEEEGLIGSKFFAERSWLPLPQVTAMLNLDMVGRMREDSLTVGGVGTAAEWRGLLERASVSASAPRAPLRLRLNEDGFGPSDHASFYARRVPVLFFFTGTHEDYHKPSDTADRLNYEGLARVTDLVGEILLDLQGRDARPTFAQARVETPARATGFRVYLGTIPAYGESTDGMKLDGVREGSPAAAAGLRAGDVIVRLAGRDVRNVYDYTQALSGMKAGQEYEVEVTRAGQRLTLKLTPAERRQ